MISSISTRSMARLGAATLLFSFVAACGSSDQAADSVEQASDVAEQSADEADQAASALSEALRENGLESIASAVQDIDVAALADSEEFTFFAPNDAAFQTLDAEQMADLLSDDGRLEATLRNHVVSERIDAEALAGVTSVETVGGMTLPVAVEGDTITVGDATVVESDVAIDDGTVHVVDGLFVEE
ncbi:MAG: fasciclin domain-containing protein [Ilumatobacter sp.]|uniref:fasciclin domain-containing protein n=1 Tax=Ilumatobacter sp. TaxID=1967498 RepID=UPI0032988B41